MTLLQTSVRETESAVPEVVETRPTFDALPLGSDVRRAIDAMGFVHPTPVQLAVYEPATQGKDLVVQARTGTGKTAAFGIPLVDRVVERVNATQVLILAPTRELALQSANEVTKLGAHTGVRTVAVYGGAPMERQVKALREGAQIVSGTPGRVLDHLRRGTLDAEGIRVLVLDEADEMLSMGFAKELSAIMELLPAKRQTLLFSATVENEVSRMAERHMRSPEFILLSGDAVGATGIEHAIYMVSGVGRAKDLVRVLEVENPESAIVFCNTKAETEQVAAELQQAGFNADWLNGDLPQSEREKIMARTRSGHLRYLVATDVAARGIDVSHLTHVVNYGFPDQLEQYIHRTGRTGRAGRTGTAISLISPQDLGSLYYLRLQYKIFPVERTLPNSREERTRREADRIAMLEAAFGAGPSEIDRAVARRLLTHPDAERLLGGLLAAFFGPGDVDDAAAAERRARPARSAERAPRDGAKASRDHRGDEAGPREPGSREAGSREVGSREVGAREGRGRRRAGGRDGRGQGAAEPHASPDLDGPVGAIGAGAAPPAADPSMTSAGGTSAGTTAASRREVDGRAATELPASVRRADDDDDDDDTLGNEDIQHSSLLFLNVGRRDGARPGDVSRLLCDEASLRPDDIGRIRVRDRHTFVTVPRDRADAVVQALLGKTFLERELHVEPARQAR